MSDLATSIPVRSNGDTVFASWWNLLRTWLIYFFGGGAIPETQFTVANNQGVAADVTGLVFTAASYRSAEVEYELSRKTDTASSEVRAIGRLRLAYRAEGTAWAILGEEYHGDEIDGLPAGVTFSITSAGQVQYTSTNISGSNYVGTLKFRARTFNA